MFTIEISDETLNAALTAHVDSLCKQDSNYSNPIKKVVDELLGSYAKSDIKDKMKVLVENKLSEYMDSPSFHLLLGQAISQEMAKRVVDAMEAKNKRNM